MNPKYNYFEMTIIESLFAMILDYKEHNHSLMTEEDFVSFINNREVQVLHDFISRNVTYYQAKKIEELTNENYNNENYLHTERMIDTLPLFNVNIQKDIFEKYNIFSFKRFLVENNLSVKSFTDLFLKDFENISLRIEYNDCEDHNRFKEEILKKGLKAFKEKHNIEYCNMIYFDLLSRFEKNKDLLTFYFDRAIILYKSKFLTLKLSKNKNENFETTYQILKKIGFFKSMSKNPLILYTSMEILIANMKIKLTKYQHDFLIAWFVEKTNIKNFKIVLENTERTIEKINTSLRQKQMNNIGSVDFNSTKRFFSKIEISKEINTQILKYLKTFE